jgi:hypothetical protein
MDVEGGGGWVRRDGGGSLEVGGVRDGLGSLVPRTGFSVQSGVDAGCWVLWVLRQMLACICSSFVRGV